MALTDYVIMPGADYQALCDKIREKTGKTGAIKSGDLVTEIELLSISEDVQLGAIDIWAYQIDASNKEVVLCSVLLDKIFEQHGDGNIYIKAMSAGDYSVVIDTDFGGE